MSVNKVYILAPKVISDRLLSIWKRIYLACCVAKQHGQQKARLSPSANTGDPKDGSHVILGPSPLLFYLHPSHRHLFMQVLVASAIASSLYTLRPY